MKHFYAALNKFSYEPSTRKTMLISFLVFFAISIMSPSTSGELTLFLSAAMTFGIATIKFCLEAICTTRFDNLDRSKP